MTLTVKRDLLAFELDAIDIRAKFRLLIFDGDLRVGEKIRL